MQTLLKSSTIKPVVNQILLHPYVIKQQTPPAGVHAEHHVVPEGTRPSFRSRPSRAAPFDKPMNAIADRLGVKPEQVLLAWSKAKG